MTASSPAPHVPPNGDAQPGAPLPIDPRALLSDMRTMLHDLETPGTPCNPHAAQKMLSAFEQIVAEHHGMADELLNVYEQLGIIFEVTKRLPSVSAEHQTLELFLHSLRRSFHGRTVCIAKPSGPQAWTFQCTCLDSNVDQDVIAALNRVCGGPRARTQVQVVDLDGPITSPAEPLRQLMIAPVCSGGQLICALVILRNPARHAAPPFKASDMSLVEALATFCGDLIRSQRLVREMHEMSVAMVRALVSAVDQKDQYTCGHSLRVGYYATALGRLLGLPESDLQMLQWSALLHDVGKIGIRDDVLNKQGRLTPEEFAHIKEHPERSHRVVQQIPQLARALDGVLHHHERYDGKGYPAGLAADAIPLQARIIQIADVFDALTSSRSYRPAFPWHEALDIMAHDAGTAIDPRLQKLFDDYIRSQMRAGPDAWNQLVRRANAFTSSIAAELAPPADGKGGDSP